jgi:hypothetical protein
MLPSPLSVVGASSLNEYLTEVQSDVDVSALDHFMAMNFKRYITLNGRRIFSEPTHRNSSG